MKKLINIIKLYKTWVSVVLDRYGIIDLKYLELRNGLKFNLEGKGSRPIISETFGNKRYTLFKDIKKNDIVVDIGAYIGDFTILARSKEARVFAFEPIEENYEKLRENISLNNAWNVQTYQKAVSDLEGKEKIQVHKIKTISSLIKSDKINQQSPKIETREITTTTLSQIIKLTKQIDFLKIDTEGNEADIILSTPREDLLKIKYIAMESTDYQETYHKNVRLMTYLIACGFKLKVLTHNNDLNCIKIYAER